ncbi:MAG: LD-carboxypeptidase [Flavobacteriales bacterium]|jgi:muramoyltetrapeptide carboxypeptidase|nr:LD-carboxypeptidase [Flavobacteriales bacterium]
MTQPANLQPNDKIAIISTARSIDTKKLNYAKAILTSWGLQVVEAPNLRAIHHQFCGTDEQRTNDLQWAIDNIEIKGIICFRGGYGTVRILDNIDFSAFITKPKWIVGYSDVTALHNKINQLGIYSLHATMPVNFRENTETALTTLRNALFGIPYSIEAPHQSHNKVGTAKGKLIGGNLSILYSLSGTKFDINTAGKILFVEDLDEYLYHIDRIMWNLKLAGKLQNLAGLIIGGMTDMHDNDTPFGKNVIEIILEATKDYDYPVCFNFPAGHIDDNQALILNKLYCLNVAPQATTLSML